MRRGFGLGDLFVVITAIMWASSFTVIKSAYDEFTPLAFAAVRFVAATGGMLVLLALLRRPLSVARRDLPLAAVFGILHVGLYQIFFSTGLRFTTATNSVLIINVSPVITALMVWLTRAEPITWRQGAGIGLAMLGTLTLVQAGGALAGGHLKGDALTFLAAASYAVTPVLVLPLLRRYATITVMGVGMLFGTLLLVVAAVPELLRQSWDVSTAAWAQLAYAAFGAGTLGYLFWYEGIGRIGPTRVAAYGYLIPVLGVAIAVTVLREAFTPVHALGAAVTLVGVTLTRWPGRRARDRRPVEIPAEGTILDVPVEGEPARVAE
ncbi:MAG: DMT family transporter [Armatimonadetes bacterium]|nr:DMT family transporter [Armatimonadota bacterium]